MTARLHGQSEDNAERTLCGRDGVMVVLGDRLSLVDGRGYAHKLAFEGEEATCTFCSRLLRGASFHGWRRRGEERRVESVPRGNKKGWRQHV